MIGRRFFHAGQAAFFGILSFAVLIPFSIGQVVPAAPQLTGTGVYTEDFTDYSAKDHTEGAVWDIWSHNLRLDLYNSSSQSRPDIAVLPDGSSLVVWLDEQDRNFYAQKLDPKGNRLWPADIQVNLANQAQPLTGYAVAPAVAVDAAGNAIAVWPGGGRIYAQKLDASGALLWGSGVQVNILCGWPREKLDIAVDSQADAVIVWDDYCPKSPEPTSGSVAIYAQKLSSEGERLWPNEIRVNQDSGITNRYFPDLAVAGNDNFIVTWRDLELHSYGIKLQRLKAQKIDPNGVRQWASDVQVLPGDSGGAHPQVAADKAGNAVITWEAGATVLAQRMDGTGKLLWSSPVTVAHAPGAARRVGWTAVSLDSAGNALIAWVWESDGNGVAEVFAQKVGPGGMLQWPGFAILSSPAGKPNLSDLVEIGVDGLGSAVAVWQDVRGPFADIYAQKLTAEGRPRWSHEVRVNTDRGITEQIQPAIAVEPDGSALFVWTDGRNGNADILAQKFSENGSRLWPQDVQVNSGVGAIDDTNPVAALDAAGNAYVVWMAGNLFAQKLDPSGNLLWVTEVQVNAPRTGTLWDQYIRPDEQSLDVDASGNVIVAWREIWSGKYNLYAQKLDPNGNRLWVSDSVVQVEPGDSSKSPPQVGIDASGNFFAVWTDARSGSWDIYAQRLGPDGARLWAEDFRLNSNAGLAGQSTPSLAVNSSDSAFVVWTDKREGPTQIYAQKLTAAGSRLWASDVRVSAESDLIGSSIPSAAIDPLDRLSVAWLGVSVSTQERNIYVQRLAENGTRLWPEDLQVNAVNGVVSYDSATIGVASDGSMTAVWEDSRNGDEDVYAQKISPEGAKGWPEDLKIVDPDTFYFEQGSAQSAEVDSVSATVLQATLASDIALNGGSVQFYLSNDGGAHWFPVSLGIPHEFTTQGSDLRWRVELHASSGQTGSPEIQSVGIEYSYRYSVYLPLAFQR
jgi:hypothetical protein